MRYLVWLLLVFLIFARYLVTRPIYQNGDMVRITTTVYSDPIDYPTSQYIKIAGLKTYLPPHQLFGVGVNQNIPFSKSGVAYGDRIVVEGVVKDGKLEKPKLVNLEPSTGVTSKLRNSVIVFYESVLPEPMSGLLAGIVLGAKGALQSDFYNQTKIAGVAHVVVASGTNITFVVSFLMGALTIFLSRRRAILFVILGIILYLFISGFDAPLIRAAIMSSFLFLGQETGRLVSTWRIFFLTAFLMLLYNPDWLIDIGFILSFVSTGSLILFERRINNKLLRLPRLLREGLSTSLAAQIGVAPILFVTFGQFNIWSPLINMLVLPVVAPLMILGAVGGVAGLIIPFIGKMLLWLSYPMLWWFTYIISIFS